MFHLLKGDKSREVQSITEDNEDFSNKPRSYQEGGNSKKKRRYGGGGKRFSRRGDRGGDRGGERGERRGGDRGKKSNQFSRFSKSRKKKQ